MAALSATVRDPSDSHQRPLFRMPVTVPSGFRAAFRSLDYRFIVRVPGLGLDGHGR